MALTVEELQIVLSCDASTAQSVLEKMDATVKAYTEKFQKYFNGMGGGKGGVANSLVSQFETAAEGIKKQTKAITKQTEDWKAQYEKTFGETFEQSMSKSYKNTGEYIPSGKKYIESASWDNYERGQRSNSAVDLGFGGSSGALGDIRAKLAAFGADARQAFSSAKAEVVGFGRALQEQIAPTRFGQALSSIGSKIGPALKSAASSAGPIFREIGMMAQYAGQKIGSALSSGAKVGAGAFSFVRKSLAGVATAVSSVGSSIKKAFQATVLGRFLKQLGRTMMRMAAMKLIRGTIQGVQQGLQELAKTSASSAKAMNTITAAGGSIKMALGAAVMPIVKALAPLFVALASAINTAAIAIANFFAVLLGQGTYSATKFSGNLDGIAESAGGAGKAAKGMLADFDELNVIANQGGGGGGGGGLSSSLSSSGGDVPAVSQFAELVKKSWEQSDFTFIGTILSEKLSGALESIPWDGINGALTKVATSISTFFNGIFANMGLADNLGSTIGQAFTTAYDTVTTLIGTLNWSNIGQFLTRAIQSAVKKFNFGSITKFISQKLIAVFEFKAGLYNGIDWKGLPKLLVDKITEAVRGFDFAGIAEAIGHWLGAGCRAALNLLDGLVDLLSGIVESIKSYFTKHINEAKEAGGSVVDGILAGIGNALSAIGSWIKKNIWDPFVKGFKEAFGIASPAKTMEEPGQMVGEGILVGITNGLDQIKSIFTQLKDKIAAGLGLAYEYVKAFFVTLADYISTRGLLIKANVDKFMNNIKIAVLEKLKDVIDGMSSGPLGKLLKLIGVDLAGASESLGKSIDKAKEKNKELDTKIGELQTKAKEGFDINANVDATKVDSYKKTLAKGWALTVTPSVDSDELRKQLRAGTKINVKVNWKPSNGTPSTQIGIVQYAAAKGGIFSAPTTVLVGEYAGASSNPEVIAPLSKLQGILERSNVGGKDTMTREQANTMINLLQRIEQKEMTVSPSVGFGQVVQRSLDAYSRA